MRLSPLVVSLKCSLVVASVVAINHAQLTNILFDFTDIQKMVIYHWCGVAIVAHYPDVLFGFVVD
jgi:hypothetical protein